MATQNPRITITLHPETYAIVKELGRLNGESMSATVGGLLDQVAPVLQRIATVLTAAEQAQAAVKDRLADDMEEAQAKMEKSLGVVLDDFEAMGQPFLDLFSDVQRKAPKGAKAERARAQRKGPAGKEPRLLAARSVTPPSNRGVRSDPKPRKKPVTARASARFTDFDSLSPNPLQNRGQK